MNNQYVDESDNHLRKLIKLCVLSEKLKKSLEIAPNFLKSDPYNPLRSRLNTSSVNKDAETSLTMLNFYKSKTKEMERKHSELMSRNEYLSASIEKLSSKNKEASSKQNLKLVSKRIPTEFLELNLFQELAKCPNLNCVQRAIKLIKLRIEHENLVINSSQTDLNN